MEEARIAKFDRNVPRGVLETIYFRVERLKVKVKVTSHKNIIGVGLCILVSAGYF